MERALNETQDVHQGVWDGSSRLERLVLLALAEGRAPTGDRLAAEHRVARSSLHDALNRIADDGQHVERTPHAGPRLVDPLLGAWLLRRPR